MIKTFDKKDIFSILNAEGAKSYIGELGYFADSLQILKLRVEENHLRKLHGIKEDYIIPFKGGTKEGEIDNFGLFIPADKVKEKTYRPFTNCTELCQYVTPNNGVILNVGDMVTIRNKENGYMYRVLVTEICYDSKFIGFGTCSFSLAELYNQYEWQDVLNKTWYPFGVEVEE